jgi:protein-tyrosine phosphatase
MALMDVIRRKYGRKQGLARSFYHGAMDGLGCYAGLGRVDWQRVARLVFVCQGNICRSAYAEARARALGLPASSFGLGTVGGDESPPLIVRVAAESGVDLGPHRSRGVEAVTLNASDLVLAMEPGHLRRLGTGAASTDVQVTLLGLWGRRRWPHIEDPFGLGPDYVRTCFGRIDAAVAAVADAWRPLPAS